MSDIAIRVENLSKLYNIGRGQQRHDTLCDEIMGLGPQISRHELFITRQGRSYAW